MLTPASAGLASGEERPHLALGASCRAEANLRAFWLGTARAPPQLLQPPARGSSALKGTGWCRALLPASRPAAGRGGASGGPALSAPRSRLHPALLRAPAQPVAAAAGGRPEGTGGGGGGGAWEAAPCGQRQGSVWRRLRWAPRWGTGPRCSRPGAVFELRGRYCLRDGEGSGLSERKALVLRETLPAGQMSSCRCPGDRGRVGVSLPLSAPS